MKKDKKITWDKNWQEKYSDMIATPEEAVAKIIEFLTISPNSFTLPPV